MHQKDVCHHGNDICTLIHSHAHTAQVWLLLVLTGVSPNYYQQDSMQISYFEIFVIDISGGGSLHI